MALIKCPECGMEISDQAINCPNCGYPVKQKEKKNIIGQKRAIFIISLILIIALLIVMFSNINTNPIDKAVQNCVEDAKDRLLSPDSMIVYSIYARSNLSFEREDEITTEALKSGDEDYETKLEEEPDDTIEVYIYYGATNRGGGISDEERMYICDIHGNILDSLTYDEFDEYIEDAGEYDEQHKNVFGAWSSFYISRLFGNLDSYTDYSNQYKSQ